MRRVTHDRIIKIPACGADIARVVAPGSATQHTLLAIGAEPSRTVSRRTPVVLVPTILNPFRDPAGNVVQAERIRWKAPDFCRLHRAVRPVASVAVRKSRLHRVAP